MDMSTMMSKIDLCKYETVDDFLTDIDLICNNALEYNPDHTSQGKAIRHRACALRDTARDCIEQDLEKEFEKQCQDIKRARQARGEFAAAVRSTFVLFTLNVFTHVRLPAFSLQATLPRKTFRITTSQSPLITRSSVRCALIQPASKSQQKMAE